MVVGIFEDRYGRCGSLEKGLGVESVILEGEKNGGTSALIADLKQYYSRTNLLVH